MITKELGEYMNKMNCDVKNIQKLIGLGFIYNIFYIHLLSILSASTLFVVLIKLFLIVSILSVLLLAYLILSLILSLYFLNQSKCSFKITLWCDTNKFDFYGFNRSSLLKRCYFL